MKKVAVLFLSISFLLLAGGRVVATDEEHEHRSLTEVSEELKAKYKVDQIEELSCEQLTRKELISLGDAVMEEMHPGEAHERMDEMMGGEGSQTLEGMHLQMGRSYLGCSQATSTTMQGGGQRSSGMMGPGMMGSGNWMSNQWGLGGWVGWLRGTVLVLIGGVLIAGIRYLWRKG